MDDTIISETNSIKVLGLHFDSYLTWKLQISDILGRARQQAGQLYRCHSLLTQQNTAYVTVPVYKSWIYPTLEYGKILYS